MNKLGFINGIYLQSNLLDKYLVMYEIILLIYKKKQY
jgi:hypothetical protein